MRCTPLKIQWWRVVNLKSLIIGFFAGVLLSGIFVFLYLSPSTETIKNSVDVDLLHNTPIVDQNSCELLGKINLNQADINQLDQIPGIGEVKAKSIIEYREKYGFFLEIKELLFVPGISPGQLDTFKQYLCIE